VELLIKRGKEGYAEELSRFYEMLESSSIIITLQGYLYAKHIGVSLIIEYG
jgi:hypothetical protein